MFQLKASLGGSEKYHGAFVSHSGQRDTRIYRECAALGLELGSLGKEIIGARTETDVAIIFDWSSRWATGLSVGPSVDLGYFGLVSRYYQALFNLRVPVDIVPVGTDLSRYKIVLAPMLYSLDPQTACIIERFVHNGGTFVASYLTGVADANDRIIPGGTPALLREVCGLWVEEIDALEPDLHNELVVDTSWHDITGRWRCGHIFELIRLETAVSLAQYGERFYRGSPCLAVNTFGKGTAYYLATDPEQAFLTEFIGTLCGIHDIQVTSDLPRGVEFTKRVRGNSEYLFFLNHSDIPVEIPAQTEWEPLTGEISDKRTIDLGPKDVSVILKRVWKTSENGSIEIQD
jgi:beta-galactosidase